MKTKTEILRRLSELLDEYQKLSAAMRKAHSAEIYEELHRQMDASELERKELEKELDAVKGAELAIGVART